MNTAKTVVVVGIDFEPAGERALAAAIELCSGRANPEVHLIHVDPTFDTVVPLVGGPLGRVDDITKRNEEVLAALRCLADGRSQEVRLVPHFRLGDPAHQIAQLAADLDADVVVVGTHARKGLRRWLLGSVAAAVLELAPCPIYVARAKGVSVSAESAAESGAETRQRRQA